CSATPPMKARFGGVSTVCESCSGWWSITSGEWCASRKRSSSAWKARSDSENSKSTALEPPPGSLAPRAREHGVEALLAALHEQQRPALPRPEPEGGGPDPGARPAVGLEEHVARVQPGAVRRHVRLDAGDDDAGLGHAEPLAEIGGQLARLEPTSLHGAP